MRFTARREALLRPLQRLASVVERRQPLPVLSNLLVVARDGLLSITATDLEVELNAVVREVTAERDGEATMPARKLLDICRSLPEGADVSVAVDGDRVIVRSGRSRFALATLPTADFPRVQGGSADLELALDAGALRRLVDRVSFSMSQQDVRYYLNGMLLEVARDHIRTVATDGHRLAMCTMPQRLADLDRVQAIVPRKSVIELARLLDDGDDAAVLHLDATRLRVTLGPYTLTTKLIDGRFPDCEKLVPARTAQPMSGAREDLIQALNRASILANERFRGIRLVLDGGQLTIQASNPEQEEAEETVAVEYRGERLEVGFNVGYLQDVLNVLDTEHVTLSLAGADSNALIEGVGNDQALYVVGPMRL